MSSRTVMVALAYSVCEKGCVLLGPQCPHTESPGHHKPDLSPSSIHTARMSCPLGRSLVSPDGNRAKASLRRETDNRPALGSLQMGLRTEGTWKGAESKEAQTGQTGRCSGVQVIGHESPKLSLSFGAGAQHSLRCAVLHALTSHPQVQGLWSYSAFCVCAEVHPEAGRVSVSIEPCMERGAPGAGDSTPCSD